MLFQHYRISKRRLAFLIVVIISLTWSLVLYSRSILTSHQLPWYIHSHDPFTSNSTTYAWTTHNQSLDDMIDFAEREMRAALTDDYDERIPGSGLTRRDQVISFRSLVACWTQQGSWQKHPGTPLPHFQDPLYGQCDRRWQHSDTARPAALYQWQPQCALLSDTIQKEQWCDIVDRRHTLVVGDLVQYQLHDLLLDALRDGPTVCYGELNCKEHTLCPRPKKSRLRYIRNDLLSKTSRVDLAHGAPATNVIEWPFLPRHPLETFKILLLNRSPVVDDDISFVQQLVIALAEIRRIQPDALILYRSSFVGHPYCDEAKGPLLDPHPRQQSKDWKSRLPFGWSEYGRRNRLAQAIVEAAGGVYLDMATSLDQRPDGHVGGKDCLRYCMPGPLDSMALLLYNVFLALGAPSLSVE